MTRSRWPDDRSGATWRGREPVDNGRYRSAPRRSRWRTALTAAGDTLVDVGTVTMNATMAMGSGMPPMMGSSFVNKTETPGRYAVETDMSMAGAWRLEVRWDGPSGKGSVTMPGTVR